MFFLASIQRPDSLLFQRPTGVPIPVYFFFPYSLSVSLGSFLPFSLVMGSEQRRPWEVLHCPAAENCQLKEEREEEAGEMVRLWEEGKKT